MIAAGATLVSRWGDTLTVHGFDPGGGIFLRKEGAPRTSFIFIAPTQVGTDYTPAPGRDARPEEVAAGFSAYRADLPSPPVEHLVEAPAAAQRATSHGAALVPDPQVAPPPTTLSGTRPSKAFWAVPFRETWYWLPCLTRSPLEEGVDTHAHFLTSNLELHVRCPACQPRRTRMSETPWGAGDPPWVELAMPSLRERFEERSASLEFEAGLDRAVADDIAYREVIAHARATL